MKTWRIKRCLIKLILTSFSVVCDRFVVAVADAAVDVKLWDGTDGVFGFALRQCLSYRMPNNTIKYSINAKNTNSVHDISHTYPFVVKREEEKQIKIHTYAFKLNNNNCFIWIGKWKSIESVI